MAEDAEARFFAELVKLREAAGQPTFQAMAARCAAELARRSGRHVGEVSLQTLQPWFTGKTLPHPKSQAKFMALIRVLRMAAEQRGAEGLRSEGWWSDLLRKARERRSAPTTPGRPRKAGGSRPERPAVMLPADQPDFSGRREQARELLALLRPDSAADTVVVAGMAGVGKTALAVHVAHRAPRKWFEGGVLFADLRGFGAEGPADDGAVLGDLLRALGQGAVPASRDERLGRWRSALSVHPPLLIVLDDAATAAQVSALRPGPPHRLLITSRNTLSALPARQIRLAPLTAGESVRLLERALRRTRDDDRVAEQPEEAARVAGLCGHLPLALQIVAALLRDEPDLPLADQAGELSDARERLSRLSYDDADDQGRPLAVRAAFELSHRRLDAERRRAFRLIGAAPGPDIGVEAAAAALDREPGAARGLLRDLARLHLVRRREGARWDMHDLLCLYAVEQVLPGEEEAILDRLVRHCLEGALRSAGRMDDPDPDARGRAFAWLDAEHRGIVAVHERACASGREAQAIELAVRMAEYWELRHAPEWLPVAERTLRAARRAGPAQTQRASAVLGNACRVARRYGEAASHLERALDLARDEVSLGHTLHNLGLVYFRLGRLEEAERCHRHDLNLCRARGDRLGEARTLIALGDTLRARGDQLAAYHALTTAVGFLERRGPSRSLMIAYANLSLALRDRGMDRCGLASILTMGKALRTAVELPDPRGRAETLGHLASLYLSKCPYCLGADAADSALTAAHLFERLGDAEATARALLSLGVARAARGEKDGAHHALRRAHAVFREQGLSEAAEAAEDWLERIDAPADPRDGCRGGDRVPWRSLLHQRILRRDYRDLDGYVVVGWAPRPDAQP